MGVWRGENSKPEEMEVLRFKSGVSSLISTAIFEL
jgi:hypothetical protein